MKIEVLHLGSSVQNNSVKKEVKRPNNEATEKENRGEGQRENRQFKNRNLEDLIRILLIRELLRRRRPQMMRPPFPPRPPMTRPPFPRGFYDSMGSIAQSRDYDIYENY